MTFCQKVEPIRAGRVSFYTNTAFGPTRRVGRRLSANFLGERDRAGWRIYHARSGYGVLAPDGLSLVAAKAIAAKLEPLTDWSVVRKPTIKHGTLASSVTGARLERIV